MACRIHRAVQHRSAIPGAVAVTLDSNVHFPRHSHDQFGIGVITFGAHRSWSGVGQVEASEGDVIMVNPGEMHDGAPFDGRGQRGWKMIYFDPALVAAQVGDEIRGGMEVVRPVAHDRRLALHLDRLFASLTGSKLDGLAREESLLHCLMAIFRRHGMARTSPFGPSPPVARALERLDSAPPNEPVSLAELAALAGVGRFQLLRGFAREVGITPHAYRVQKRVLAARMLLARGAKPADVAVEAGFADQSHMTRAFVRQFGVTPGRYRAAVA